MNNKSSPFGQMNTRDQIEQAEFDQFRQFLEDACGISLGDNKQYLVTNRIRRILEENNITSFGELVKELRLGFNRKLKEQVIDSMTTNETFWFRDNYPYDHLKENLFPQLMTPTNRMFGPVRIWSAACSSGQEPYSISITVEEYKQKAMGVLMRPVQVVATDLSSSILDQARRGEYDKLSMIRGLTSERLERYFDKQSNDIWRVKAQVKERIEFRPFNLMDSYAALGKFDVIFCRNVLIYFNGDLKREILQKIHAALGPQGILFLGSSEGLAGVADLFEMVRCNSGIFYRAL